MIAYRLTKLTFAFVVATFLLIPTSVYAQVAITAGVQGLYDDNIFLEDDSISLPPELSDPANFPEGLTLESLKQVDGKKDDDFIMVPSLSIASAIPVGQNFDSSVEVSIAALMFTDNTDESRLTLDSHLTFGSSDTLLPDPLFFKVSSMLNSQSSSVSIAQGSTARQSQSHTATLVMGASDWSFAKLWTLSAKYALTRYDYLKEWTFDDREERPYEEKGSDYTKNGLYFDIKNETSKQLTTSLNANVDYTSFSNSNSNDIDAMSKNDLNRIGYGAGVRATYLIQSPITVSASLGFDGAHYPDRESDSNENSTNQDVDDNELSLRFGTSAIYTPDLKTSIEARINQTNGTDTDGQSIVSRSFALNGNRRFGDLTTLIVGGRFLQFQNGDELNDASERFELTTALSITLTKSITLSLGYNYADQNSDKDSEFSFHSSGHSYTSHRVFIGLSGGLVGIKG